MRQTYRAHQAPSIIVADEYLAKWKGYSQEHDKVWYHGENFNHAEQTVQLFHRHYPRKPGVDTRYDQHIVLRTSPRRQTTRHSHTPENDAQGVPHNATLTGPDYSGSLRREVAHTSISWTDCPDDGCQMHLGENKGQAGTHNSPGDRNKQASPTTTIGDRK